MGSTATEVRGSVAGMFPCVAVIPAGTACDAGGTVAEDDRWAHPLPTTNPLPPRRKRLKDNTKRERGRG